MRTILLFDIDGTLVLTGRAGLRALTRVFAEHGLSDAFAGISAAGRTDGSLLEEASRRVGIDLTAELRQHFQTRYCEILAEEILKAGEGRKQVLPGVRTLVDALRDRDDVVLALLTGNFRTSARIKLEHFDLWSPFPFGAFADDATDRNLLVPVALDRAREAGHDPAHERVIVIGDTPLDVECARAGGVRVLGVATGSHTLEELQEAGADATVADLSDTAHVLDLLLTPQR